MKLLISLVLPLLFIVPGDKQTYFLNSGKRLQAEVLKVEQTRVQLRVYTSGGSFDAWYKLDDLTPHSGYRILQLTAKPDDAEAHLRLATFAASKDLVASAQRELQIARRISGNKHLAPELENRIAQRGAFVLERLFHRELEANRPQSARRFLSAIMIRYPHTMSASRKAELLALVENKKLSIKDSRLRKRNAREEARSTRQREALLAPLRKHLKSGRAMNRKGLMDSKHYARAHDRFMRAVRHFESVVKGSESLLRKHKDDALLAQHLGALHKEATASMRQSLLNAGSLCLVRGKFTTAMGHVNRILAFDAQDEQALAMRARIEIAANQWGYGYGAHNG